MTDLIVNDEVFDLGATDFLKELAMYKRVQACLAEHLSTPLAESHPGSQVFDTHQKDLIFGLRPDMSIVTANTTKPTVGSLIAVVEMKVGNLTKEAFGQLYDYLKGIKRAQPNRRTVVGLLSNLRENQFLMLETPPGRKTRCTVYNSVKLDVALTYLRDVVIRDPIYHPPASVFAAALGPLDLQLGNPAFSVVGVFFVPDMATPKFQSGRWVDPAFQKPYGDVQMVVKRTTPGVSGTLFKSRAPRTVETEIEMLLKIKEMPRNDPMMEGWKHVPTLLYHTHDYQEFGILPRGFSVSPYDTGANWVRLLHDLLDALEWLHTHQIVHRDVRLDNIVWDITHAVLIDFGTAIDIHGTSDVAYHGGYLCCPPRLLGNLDGEYTPVPADDCFAVVLLVNTILFPSRWESFRSVELEKPGSPETRNLAKFWDSMETSRIWSRFYAAARKADYATLKEMDQFFVYLF